MKYYVYKIINPETSEYYIGSRLCKDERFFDLPNLDFGIKYKTSSKIVNEIGFDNFQIVLFMTDFASYDECYAHEQLLIYESINDPLCLNQACFVNKDGSVYKMNSHNRMVTEETRRKISEGKTGKKRTPYP